jgi:hypothetical protein
MRALRPTLGLMLAVSASASPAAIVEYRVSGTMVKEPLSDNLFNARTARVPFDIRFTADTAEAVQVPAGRRTSLPNFPQVVLPQDGFILPAGSLHSFAFRAAGTNASFSRSDVIADEATGGAVFIAGPLERPTAISLLLANGISGTFQIGIPECARTCALKGGLVLDRAGPFGSVEIKSITARTQPTRPPR